jgi:NAD(P)-dependent dehydrogenase (short-subunit alcohol dehydrogenase family)
MTRWTEAEVLNLKGRNIIITGANSGIGFHASQILAKHGARVIMACRNQSKAQVAKLQCEKQELKGSVEIASLDLNSLESVAKFSESMLEKLEHLDCLVNNAGIMMPPYQLTKDGFESQLGVNHLGHFALTGRLLPLLQRTANSRVVSVSSIASNAGKFNFDDLHYKNTTYNSMLAYGRSKLANLLFGYELDRKLKAQNSSTISLVVHPGTTTSNLMHYITENRLINLMKPLSDLYTQSAYMGSLPTIRAVVDPNVKGGEYFGPRGLLGHRGYPKQVRSSKLSHNQEVAQKLWDTSEILTKVNFRFA